MVNLAFSEPPLNDLKAKFVEFYSRNGIVTETIEEAISYIYGNELDQDHDIYDLGNDSFLVLPALLAFPKDVLLDVVQGRRKQEQDPAGDEFRVFIENTTAGAKCVHQHLLSLRNSRRKFTVFKPVPEFPAFEELKEFHECKRKPPYGTKEDAEARIRQEQRSYLCNYCSAWHNGHPPTGNPVSREALEKRYKRTWRRYKDL